jgi:hypothetical protein
VRRPTAIIAMVLLVTACGGDDGSSADTTATTTTAIATTTTAALYDGLLRVRPVRSVLPVDGIELGLIGDDVTDGTVIAPEPQAGIAYDLGVSALDEGDVSTAEAREMSGSWTVVLTFSAEGQAALDELTARCFARDASCARGQIAITVDGEVVAAPVVTAATIGPGLTLTAPFSAEQAQALAAALG